jgi:hypothetical protein
VAVTKYGIFAPGEWNLPGRSRKKIWHQCQTDTDRKGRSSGCGYLGWVDRRRAEARGESGRERIVKRLVIHVKMSREFADTRILSWSHEHLQMATNGM